MGLTLRERERAGLLLRAGNRLLLLLLEADLPRLLLRLLLRLPLHGTHQHVMAMQDTKPVSLCICSMERQSFQCWSLECFQV